ncbi:MAG: hypothetical protein ACK4IX_05270 [Candidatus Sericytochromatia bacterium]
MVNSIQSVNTISLDTTKAVSTPKNTQPSNDTIKVYNQDVVIGVKRTVTGTFKGAGAGAATAGLTSLAAFAIATKGKPFAGDGAIISVPLVFAAGLGGAVGGAVASNMTTEKGKGALYGAMGGALVGGAAVALANKNISGFIAGAVLGGITGAVGGVGGSMVAKQK